MAKSLKQRLAILSDAAKYDASCASSGTQRRDSSASGGLGSTEGMGICHAYAPDGRCISLLKILLTNFCLYDCVYCVNRSSSNVERARFSAEEVVWLTLEFYRRNYIEGLFLSSGIIRSSDYTMEQLVRVAKDLRTLHNFRGYIHLKTIPEASPQLIEEAGLYADRLSINIELPTDQGIEQFAPQKHPARIRRSMSDLSLKIEAAKEPTLKTKRRQRFAPGGQSTQMIVGVDGATDATILGSSVDLYSRFRLRRVYYSAFSPIPDASSALPLSRPPLMREHRLYQADWLLRFYGFKADELLDDQRPNLDPGLDPKCNWAVGHLDQFPVDVNQAPYEMLLRVPGVGVKSAGRILQARRHGALDFEALRKIGVVLKRAQHFLTCSGKPLIRLYLDNQAMLTSILSDRATIIGERSVQLSLLDPTEEDLQKCLTGQI